MDRDAARKWAWVWRVGAAFGDFLCARRLSAALHNSLRSDRCEAAEAAHKKSSKPRNTRHTHAHFLTADISGRQGMVVVWGAFLYICGRTIEMYGL